MKIQGKSCHGIAYITDSADGRERPGREEKQMAWSLCTLPAS